MTLVRDTLKPVLKTLVAQIQAPGLTGLETTQIAEAILKVLEKLEAEPPEPNQVAEPVLPPLQDPTLWNRPWVPGPTWVEPYRVTTTSSGS